MASATARGGRAVRDRRRPGSIAAYAAAAGLALAGLLAGCSGEADEPNPSPTATGSTDSSDQPSPSASTSGGTAEAPTVLEPQTDTLDWTPVRGDPDETVVIAGSWRLAVPGSSERATLSAPNIKKPIVIEAGPRGRITTAQLNERWALVVSSDRQEQRPGVATLVDLRTLQERTLDGDSELPTVNGGSWALGETTLLHATTGPKRAYCLASVTLPSLASELAWCAPPRHGFTNAGIGVGGPALMSFDDSRPSCRTVGELVDNELVPFAGVPDCTAWEGVTLSGARAWTVIENEKRIEAAHAYAAVGDGYFDLGPAKSGTLVRCGDAVFFARDPETDAGPAQLLRWSPTDGLAVVYESPRGGPAFIGGAPRCGGSDLTLTALSAGGDEQVTARLG